jgi:hypothetical protein
VARPVRKAGDYTPFARVMATGCNMEETQGMGQGQDTTAPATDTAPASAPAHADSGERTFRQSDVSEIVRREKAAAVEAFRRQQQQQYSGESHRGQQETATQYQPSESPDDRVRRLAAEAAQGQIEKVRQDYEQRSQEEMAQKTVQSFWNKVLTGREKYQDFDKVIGGINLGQYPGVVQLLAEAVDNSGDMLYHLAGDEARMAELQRLAEDPRFQHIAVAQARRISQSLKDNDAASKVRLPNEPLSQLRPSSTGTDSGAMSVRDYRNKYRV